ncbi:MAG: hypothetical protein Q8O89_06560, partial [Nanoarchaeota archaeon]|nr:hypothetical protein [Nanoarchaeota archaeon]
LRGGAYKPRTDPESWEGLGEEGLELLVEIRQITGLPVITEIIDASYIPLFQKYNIDIYQVGARNGQNFVLLDALSKIDAPVLLKRGDHLSISEYLLAAKRVYRGNKNLILCERGDKTTDEAHRNILNLNNIPIIRQKYHLPIIIDPSHGTGRRESIKDMSLAGIAAGANGLIIEVHYKPEEAKCDGAQSINGEFRNLVPKVREMYNMINNN